MRRDDWLLAQLPVGMVEDDFFRRFVTLFQDVATGLVDGADNIDNVVDVTVTPPAMLQWLASWIGVSGLDPTLPDPEQRRIVRSSSQMLAWRGTRRGLAQFLEMITGVPAVFTEGGGVFPEGGAPAEPAWARVEVQSTGWLTESDFVALLRDEVPAHVALEVWLAGRRIWPHAETDLDLLPSDVAAAGGVR